jgi:Flp pilus assembly pilin Flp
MRSTLTRLWDDERGIETLEWLAIAVLVLIVAFAIYSGALQQGLLGVATTISEKISGAAGTIGGS